MPGYRLVFPVPEGFAIENAETAHIESGDTIYKVGDEIEHGGKRWQVTMVPLDTPTKGEEPDLLVWPAD